MEVHPRKLWRKHRKKMSRTSRHLQRNQRRPSQQTRKGRVLLLQTVLCRKNRLCSWQQRPKTQIQTLKKRHHQRSPPKAMLPKARKEGKLWRLLCQIGYFGLRRSSNQKLTGLDILNFFKIHFMVL